MGDTHITDHQTTFWANEDDDGGHFSILNTNDSTILFVYVLFALTTVQFLVYDNFSIRDQRDIPLSPNNHCPLGGYGSGLCFLHTRHGVGEEACGNTFEKVALGACINTSRRLCILLFHRGSQESRTQVTKGGCGSNGLGCRLLLLSYVYKIDGPSSYRLASRLFEQLKALFMQGRYC